MQRKYLIAALTGIAVLLIILVNQTQEYKRRPSYNKPVKQEANDTKQYFEMRELGIRFEQPDDLKNLSYSVRNFDSKSTKSISVFFSTKSITDLVVQLGDTKGAENCTADDGPLGVLTGTDEYPNDGERPLTAEEAQIIDNAYLYYSGPQSVCSDNEAVQQEISSKMQSLRVALNTLQSLKGDTGTALRQGTLEGSLSYPSGGIPSSMQVCAISTTTRQSFCS
ncbi:MAG: hypothetical protein M3Q64_03220, partial [bacterium]|nr:hypothetical protein [bacterium]